MKRDTIINSKRVENVLYYSLMFFILIFIFTRCGNENPSQPVDIGTRKIIATYIHPDGRQDVGVILQVISKTVKTDSATNKDEIVLDTLYGRPEVVPILDSEGNPTVDSTGKPRYTIAYFPIGKDSVNWKIQNIPVDSLIRNKD